MATATTRTRKPNAPKLTPCKVCNIPISGQGMRKHLQKHVSTKLDKAEAARNGQEENMTTETETTVLDPETQGIADEATEMPVGEIPAEQLVGIDDETGAEIPADMPVGEAQEKLTKAQRKEREKAAKAEAKSTAKAEKQAKTESPCLCGCGRTSKSRFAPGHDARKCPEHDVKLANCTRPDGPFGKTGGHDGPLTPGYSNPEHYEALRPKPKAEKPAKAEKSESPKA